MHTPVPLCVWPIVAPIEKLTHLLLSVSAPYICVRYSMDFSPKSGFLALGNDKGRVLLYRLKHYCDV